MEEVTFEQLRNCVVVLLMLCGSALTVVSLIKTVKELRKPRVDRQAQDGERIAQMLANDKARLDAHEHAIEHISQRIDGVEHSTAEQGKDIRELMGGVMALLEHELHNGNSAEMDEASKSLRKRLIDK